MDKFKIKDLVISLEVELCKASQRALSHVQLCKSSHLVCTDDLDDNEREKLIEQLEDLLEELKEP